MSPSIEIISAPEFCTLEDRERISPELSAIVQKLQLVCNLIFE